MSGDSESSQDCVPDPRDLKIAEQARTISDLTAQVKDLEAKLAELQQKLAKLEALLVSGGSEIFEGSGVHGERQPRPKRGQREETEKEIHGAEAC